ncbi:uncharacterized protein LOC144128664 isoform X2 [Amblyomma americanum]
MDDDAAAAPPPSPAAPCGGRRQSAMRTAAISLLLHLLCSCSPLWWPLAGGAVRNRTEDLPIVFPDDNAATTSSRTARRLPEHRPVRTGIPESVLFRMRGVQNLTDFVSQFLEGYPDATVVDGFEGQPSILGKKGPVGGSSASLPNPEPGTCLPSKQLVEFPKPTDPSIILWPPCTRIPRCGGCCPSTILKCAPIKSSNVTFKVIKAQYPEPGASKFNFVGHEVVTLEKHDKCSCECKERPADCNALQEYHECRCVCRNNHEMASCNGAAMVWDHRDCRCKCRDYAECSTGFYFNTRSCRCESLGGRARIASRIRQPLPKLYAPYTDNRENVQSRSYRNLDIVAADDYSRPYTEVEHAAPVRRDVSAKTTAADSDSTTTTTTRRTVPASSSTTLEPRTSAQRLTTAATSSSASTATSRSKA